MRDSALQRNPNPKGPCTQSLGTWGFGASNRSTMNYMEPQDIPGIGTGNLVALSCSPIPLNGSYMGTGSGEETGSYYTMQN